MTNMNKERFIKWLNNEATFSFLHFEPDRGYVLREMINYILNMIESGAFDE